jgi:MFS family permease
LNRAFLVLLTAKTISATGAQVTLVALPLTAVLFLHASPFQMGLLGGAAALPGVLFGLVAGFAIDHVPKRRVLILANGLNAVILAFIPLGYFGHFLSIALLLGAGFLAAAIANAEGIALISFIPEIVPEAALARANGRYGAITSVTQVIGPALAGGLIALVTAPGAITLDSATLAAATVLMCFLPEVPVSDRPAEPQSIIAKLRSGVDFMLGHRTIRLFTIIIVAVNLFGAAIAALQALFIVGQLGVPPAWYGAALAGGGVGAVAGALASGAAAARFNVNLLLTAVIFVATMTGLFIRTLHGAPWAVATGFAAAQAIGGVGNGILGAAMMTYIQKAAPPEMLARLIGALTTCLGASVPLGALSGGVIAGAIGIRATLFIATGGFALVLAVLLMTSRRRLLAPPEM